MKKTVQFLTLGFFAVMVIGVCATPRGGEKTNPTQAKLDAWRREVKKIQTAPVADGFIKLTGF